MNLCPSRYKLQLWRHQTSQVGVHDDMHKSICITRLLHIRVCWRNGGSWETSLTFFLSIKIFQGWRNICMYYQIWTSVRIISEKICSVSFSCWQWWIQGGNVEFSPPPLRKTIWKMAYSSKFLDIRAKKKKGIRFEKFLIPPPSPPNKRFWAIFGCHAKKLNDFKNFRSSS